MMDGVTVFHHVSVNVVMVSNFDGVNFDCLTGKSQILCYTVFVSINK